jgi:hypothetical protein
MQVYKQLRREDPAAYQPLAIAIKQAKCLPPHVSGLEVYNAFKFAFGYSPSRDDEGRCIYTQTQLEIVAATCSIEAIYLSELEQWRKLVPLAGCQSRRTAMHKLSLEGITGLKAFTAGMRLTSELGATRPGGLSLVSWMELQKEPIKKV